MRRLLGLLLLLAALPAAGRPHPTAHRQHALWIGAHPDDEALVAPLLALDGDSSILVFTRGEQGTCDLPGGCGTDLGAIRAAEMDRAAALLHAHLTLWAFADVGGNVDATWSAEAGSHAELIRRIRSAIASENPTIIYTFDPNHGSTCHPAHRAVGSLVTEAAAPIGIRVLYLETYVDFLPDSFVFRSTMPSVIPVDVTFAWDWLVRDAAVHQSQFTPERIEELRRVPAEQRRIWLSTVPLPADLCTLPNSSISIHDSTE